MCSGQQCGNDTSDAGTLDVKCKFKLSVSFSISTGWVVVNSTFMVLVYVGPINFRWTK